MWTFFDSAVALAGVATLVSGVAGAPTASSLPVVDLGYSIHQAISFNSTGNFYNFSNVRYAAPPLNLLRFAEPHPPVTDRAAIQNGSIGRLCPQASPAWQLTAAQFVPAYLLGLPINSTVPAASSSNASAAPRIDPRTTEDCLFLDVVVPKEVFDAKNSSKSHGAPVVVWIYGGGYVNGDKAGNNPAGLLKSGNNTQIYVAINYRLGAFGWLSGRKNGTFTRLGGTSNAGLHDQRFALQWVQRNIAKFGGDPKRVTVIGESAGGGSIMHQITAYGGKQAAPFQQAILQSPGFTPIVDGAYQDQIFNNFLRLNSVKDLAGLRALPTQTLITSNILMVAASLYGQFTFGPTVDDCFVPDLPGRLLQKGRFSKSVKMMLGHNANEGLVFTSPQNYQNLSFYTENLKKVLITPSAQTLAYINSTVYPPVFNTSGGYRDAIARASLTTAELAFTCNTFYLAQASGNTSYSYLFTVPPALHAQDIPYTFYNGQGASTSASAGVANVTDALTLQSWITSFAATGVPASAPRVNGNSVPAFPVYGRNASVAILGQSAVSTGRDDAANPRCVYWQGAPYAPAV